MTETAYFKSGVLVNSKFREFFIPTVLSTMAGQLGVIVDSIIVGNFINAGAMASVGVCMPLNQLVAAIMMLISVGSGGLAAIASGARQHDEANRIFSAVTFLCFGIGALITLLCLPFTREIARFLSSADALVEGGWAYLHILIWRFPFMLALGGISVLIRSDGMAGLVSRAVLIGQVVNIGLDLLLIGPLKMGLEGAALATVISDIVGSGYLMIGYFKSSERTFRLVNILSNGLKSFISLSFNLIRSGVPAASGVGLVSLKVWCIYAILGKTGGAGAMTIYAVCVSCLSFVSMFISGGHRSMIPIVGVLYGEKDYQGIRMLARHVLKFTLLLVGAFVLFVLLSPQTILSLFNLPPELMAEGANAIRLFSISLIGVAVTFLMLYYYTTVQQRTAANILSFVEGFLAVVPLAWLLSKPFGLTGVWLAFILAELVGFLCIYLYIRVIREHSNGKFFDVYLIERNGKEMIYDVSIKATDDDAAKLSIEVLKVLKDNGIDELTASRAALALEEMTANLANYPNNKQAADIDLRISNADGKIILALRDNGRPFNPVEYSPDEQTDYRTDGIMLLKAIAKNIQYSRVLSLNQTIIEL
ncbi:MAG: ATP-binding protein [Synergistaceae bacterium]|nr:ATP-binding protein [Synergistaceae bacterium]